MSVSFRRNDPTSESSYALLDLPPRHNYRASRRFSEDNQESISASQANSEGDVSPHDRSTASTAAALSSTGSKKPTFLHRLGWFLLLTNIGALILLLGALSALSFLWFGDETNSNWRQIMIDGWIGQAVTLSTLAIRLAVATQASTAVAMLAAVSLECSSYGGVLLAEPPALSLARYVNTGPLTTFLPFWSNATWPKCGPILPLILLLAMCTLVSQFTSTLLLWDVRSGVLHGSPNKNRGASGMGMEDYIEGFQTTVEMGQNYWLSSPQTFPTFAEWSAKPAVNIDPVADTGPTIRAFIPMNSQLDRSMLSKFEGTAAAFDSRVICVRPFLTDWAFVYGNVSSDVDNRGYFNGYARPTQLTDEMKQLLRYNKSELGVSFRCIFDDLDIISDPMFKICSVGGAVGGLINRLDQASNISMDHYFNNITVHNAHYSFTNFAWMAPNRYSAEQWPVEMGHTFLLLRSTGNTTDILEGEWGDNSMNFTAKDRGVWVDLSSPADSTLPYPSNVTAEVSVTMCYDAWYNNDLADRRVKHIQEFPISANRSTNISEPSLGWNNRGKTFDTTSVRMQLGASQDQNTTRSILQLDIGELEKVLQYHSAQWSPGLNFSFNDARLSQTLWFLNSTVDVPGILDFYSSFNNSKLFENNTYGTNETYDFLNSAIWWPFNANAGTDTDLNHFEIYIPCEQCTSYRTVTSVLGYPESVTHQVLNPILNTIFRDTIIETDNPAVAWQALMTTILRMAYYDWLPTFGSTADMETVSRVPCQTPIYYTGFAIVLAILVVHLGLVVAATTWFARVTRASLLNNSWQVLAQLKSPNTEEILDNATMADDRAVRQCIGARPELRRRFKITGGKQSERAHLS